MEEIAASMTAAGLPPGFHQAAADIYQRAARADVPEASDPAPAEPPSTLDSILSALGG